MPILQTEFTCPNSHTFNANAKIRARCPTCGQMARKDFTKPVEVTKPKEAEDGPVLLRQGKIMPRKAHKPVTKPLAKAPNRGVDKRGTRAGAVNKGPAQAVGGKVANGIVTTHKRLTKGTMPKVRKMPPKTAVARHVTGESRSNGPIAAMKSYAEQQIARAMGRG